MGDRTSDAPIDLGEGYRFSLTCCVCGQPVPEKPLLLIGREEGGGFCDDCGPSIAAFIAALRLRVAPTNPKYHTSADHVCTVCGESEAPPSAGCQMALLGCMVALRLRCNKLREAR